MPTSTTAGKKEGQKWAGNLVSVVRQSILSLFTVVWNWVAGIRRITFKGLIVVLALVCVPLLVILEMVRYPNTSVDPMSVPPELVSMGYTPEVVARRLIDSIHEFGDDEVPIAGTNSSVSRMGERTIMGTIGLEHNSPELDFVVPTIGLSIKLIAAYLNDLLRPLRPRITVSGELLHVESDKRVFLRLRINKEKVADIHTSPGEINEEKMNKLFHDAAYQVIKNFDSSVLATIEDQITILNLQGIMYFNDDFNVALKKFEKAIELDPEYALVYRNWGVALAAWKGDYDGAIEKFKKAIELDPEYALAYRSWGVVLAAWKGDYDGAIEKFKKAIELDPENASAYNNWGVALAGQGYYDAAVEKHKKAIELDPEDSMAYNNWGIALAAQDDYDGAIEKYKEAIELDPENASAYNNWGATIAGQGYYDAAIEKYKEAIELDPEDSMAYNNWGLALAGQGDYDDAIEKYKEAIELDPKYASAYNNWGATLVRKGHYDDAIEKYKKAIELNPKDSVACRNWGAVLAKKGDCEKAADMDCELSPDDLKTICPESLLQNSERFGASG